ncbi:hypothetical protein LJB96_05560 [Methanobrevibacter sp. OttesenSCG-928-K11]|nr:hypothetical protein [Methanobrevibacter sp. OttesenSCG-928-K11]MDL2270933.1 hypothetical protein [Methanobrevibacter sp. OttesenSCG-928-I08]
MKIMNYLLIGFILIISIGLVSANEGNEEYNILDVEVSTSTFEDTIYSVEDINLKNSIHDNDIVFIDDFDSKNSNNISKNIISSKIEGYDIIVSDEYGNVFKYEIKGVCYSRENPTMGIQDYEKHFEDDLKKLRALNANTVKTYRPLAAYSQNGEINYELTKYMLDRFAQEGISVAVGFDLNKDILTGSYKKYIESFSNHPAILMWVFGNEYNYHYGEWFSEEFWLNELDKATKTSKELSPNRITAVVHGELPTSDEIKKYNGIINLDLIMLTVYRGPSFSNLFTSWENLDFTSTQPLVLSEFGRSSKSAVLEEDTSELQSNTLKSLWLEIDKNNVSAGGFIFELNDESWKGDSNFETVGSERHLGLFLDQFTICSADAKLAAKTIAELWDGDISNYPEANYKNISLIGENIIMYYKDGSKYIVTLKDPTGKVMPNQNLIVTINGVTSTRITDDNGQIAININLNPGFYRNIVKFQGNSEFGAVEISNSLEVKSTIIGNDINKHFKNDTHYYVTILDSNGNPLNNTGVKMNINGVFYNSNTNSEGIAKLSINLNPGMYIITVHHPNGQTWSNNIKVVSTIEGNDITKYFRNDTQYYATLKNDKGDLLINRKITMNINGVFYYSNTDLKGAVKLTINLNPETYIITVYHPDNGQTWSNKITVLPTLKSNDLNKKFGETGDYEVKVVDGQGNIFKNQNVTMNINGILYEKATDSEGIAKLEINLNPGQYIITSSCNGYSISNIINIFDLSNYKLVISYNGPYTAGWGSASSSSDVSTSGYQEYNLGKTTYVDVGAKKSNGGTEALTIQIYKENQLVEQKSTNNPYGEVIINYKEN